MQGTRIGVPLTAVEPRITAADFGVLGHQSLTEATAEITVPVEFLLPWDGEHVERQSGLVGELRAQECEILRVERLADEFHRGLRLLWVDLRPFHEGPWPAVTPARGPLM
jgi:hypothetical protein